MSADGPPLFYLSRHRPRTREQRTLAAAVPRVQRKGRHMSGYRKPDRCAWCCARLTPENAAVVGDDLVCSACADLDGRRAMLRARAAMKATARGLEA